MELGPFRITTDERCASRTGRGPLRQVVEGGTGFAHRTLEDVTRSELFTDAPHVIGLILVADGPVT